MDKIDPIRRSANMARIKGRNTAPELAVRRIAHGMGLRFRLHRSDLPGKPDIVFPRHRLALFVNGCFWHRHVGCRKATTPTTRPEFWDAKFRATVDRDARQHAELQQTGWRVLVLWECQISQRPIVENAIRAFIFPTSEFDDLRN
ncbi:MAG: very short patch repair endonuclease [Brevundimonas sp.]|uniref:very short patch repair endonuclease n=1 Tax=Brevundimonas sp. TaxID=1871086 RepID=UPI00391BC88E